MPRYIHPAMGLYYVRIDLRVRAIDEASAEYREAVANAEADRARARAAAERLAGLLNVPVWVP